MMTDEIKLVEYPYHIRVGVYLRCDNKGNITRGGME